MSLGRADQQTDLLDDVSWFCEGTLSRNSIYSVLHRERHRLFPDEMFADLFSHRGRRSVPPSVVATVMVLQRLGGLSDREAVERYSFDARWRYAAGVGGYDRGQWGQFAHTVLVDMRARLKASEAPRRLFEVTKAVASQAGLVGAKRVLDSTPLYDAVATMDTITLIRSAIRSLLRVADEVLEGELRETLGSGDDYATSAKPQIDWDDADAREQLIDSRARDAFACLLVLEGRVLSAEVQEAAELLVTVVGQDLEQTEDGTFRIARRVAKDRVISTVDPEARHGHKTSSQGFDGYKGHVSLDPDSEIITQTAVTAGNAGDASVATDLIDDLVDSEVESSEAGDASAGCEPETSSVEEPESERPKVYGDAAYGTGEFLDHLEKGGIDSGCKTQPPSNRDGLFPKSRFEIDLDTDTVTCPAGLTAPIRRTPDGSGVASFAGACADCPLRAECTQAARGRSIRVGPHERQLAEARQRQEDPDWAADYRATRPKVERKIGHLMRRRHGGRRSRVRGQAKVDADFNLLAAAHNLARFAVLGIRWTPLGWVAEMA
jgi:IS5 family transposase